MAKSSQEKNLLTLFVGSVTLSTTLNNTTEATQWTTSSCSRLQPAMDSGVRDYKSNWLDVTATLCKATPTKHHLHGSSTHHKSACDRQGI